MSLYTGLDSGWINGSNPLTALTSTQKGKILDVSNMLLNSTARTGFYNGVATVVTAAFQVHNNTNPPNFTWSAVANLSTTLQASPIAAATLDPTSSALNQIMHAMFAHNLMKITNGVLVSGSAFSSTGSLLLYNPTTPTTTPLAINIPSLVINLDSELLTLDQSAYNFSFPETADATCSMNISAETVSSWFQWQANEDLTYSSVTEPFSQLTNNSENMFYVSDTAAISDAPSSATVNSGNIFPSAPDQSVAADLSYKIAQDSFGSSQAATLWSNIADYTMNMSANSVTAFNTALQTQGQKVGDPITPLSNDANNISFTVFSTIFQATTGDDIRYETIGGNSNIITVTNANGGVENKVFPAPLVAGDSITCTMNIAYNAAQGDQIAGQTITFERPTRAYRFTLNLT